MRSKRKMTLRMPAIAFGIAFLFTKSLLAQHSTSMQVKYAQAVGDSFEIYISLPPGYRSADTCKVVYYCDANLKSGKYLRTLLSTSQFHNLKHVIFVGVGHIGNYHVLRRRDFILPAISGSDTSGREKNYGHADHFYNFLANELIPSINKRYLTWPNRNAILGHSLGGLFTFYCLFKGNNLFTSYFALSPALWVDGYSIYQFNHLQNGFSSSNYLYFVAGSRETVNRILNGTNAMKNFLDEKRYRNLKYDYQVWPGQTHNSEVPLSLEKIMKEKL